MSEAPLYGVTSGPPEVDYSQGGGFEGAPLERRQRSLLRDAEVPCP